MPEFCHLHCHTQYSLLDGAARIKRLVQRADRMDLGAVAITDHGNLYGVPEFYTTAQQHGVQPIIGCEFYLTPSGIQDKTDATRYHQVLLAKNETGYKNLMALSSKSFIDGFYYKPRIDHALLRKHSEGLIATTCCLQGEVLQTILKRGEEAARPIFEAYLDIFGDDYYIEIQAHGIDDQDQCNEVLLRWAKEYDVKVIATNDVHYVDQQDAKAQDVLLCLQTGKDYHDPNRMRFENDQFFLKGTAEMQEALTGIDPKIRDAALDHTREIADKCRFELPMPDLLMPHYPVPDRFDDDMDAYLRHMVFQRAESRYGEMTQTVTERLESELGIIKQMGYAGYFLIVQDFTTAARELDVRVGPGRGSAAGSAVAYCLGITNVDPLQYDLLFERFLNPERVSMPDIDIDFDDRGRAKVIDYVVQKYGRENVCQIITFGTMGAKTVLRDVSRVLGVPLSRADEIAKMIPDGVGVDLDQALSEVPEFRQLKGSDDHKIQQLMQYAEVLEGSARHTGVHAAGVIIAPSDVSDHVPVSVSKSKGEKVITTQYDGDWVEKFGLLKMDFLGLKTLTVINDALAQIEENHGVEIDLDAIPLDDEATFRLFQQGDTVSIFQFESTGMREWLRKLKPTEIGDLIAMNALYRPGPMDLIPDYIARKHGEEEVSFPHPSLEAVLKPTYGIPVFQEQVMKMAQVMAGYSLGQADILRRCVTGDTLVIDADTGARIRVDDVTPGTRLQTLDSQHRLQTAPVREVFDNGTKPVYRVRTRSGRTIRLTAEHPLLTVGGWQHLCDLGVGDFIATPSTLPVSGMASPDPARVKVLAYLLGDGCTRRKGGYAQAFFYNNDPEVLRDYQDAAEALGATTRTYTHADTGVTTVTARGAGGASNPIVALIHETDLAKLAHEKRVPDEVFGYDEATLRQFLGTLWTTDGSVERTRLSYSSSSPDLVDDVAHLLLRLGIVSMRRARQTTHRDNFELVIADQEDVLRFAETVGPHLCTVKGERLDHLANDARSRKRTHSVHSIPAEVGHLVKAAKTQSGLSWRAAGERIGRKGNDLSSGLNLRTPRRALSRHRVQALGDAFSSTALTDLAQSDVLWDPIIEVTPLGDERVYDLSVPPHANFVAADVVIHNSMGKKKMSVMNQQRGVFVEGAAENGVGEAKANEVFDMMAKFAGYGFNKCVVGETEISHATTGERTTVGELFRSSRDWTIHALGGDGRLRPRRVTDVVWNGRKPVYELETALGKKITATGNHPFRALGGWTNLEDLSPGDRIAAPRALPVETNASWPNHELVTLAGLIAEGTTCHPSGLYFYSNDAEQADDFARHAERFPDSVARIHERRGGRLEVSLSTGRDTRFRPGQTPWNAVTNGKTTAAAPQEAHLLDNIPIRGGAPSPLAGEGRGEGGRIATAVPDHPHPVPLPSRKRGRSDRPVDHSDTEPPTRSGAFRWAEQLGLLGKTATEKFVPKAVFTLCTDDLALFLGRLWTGDGFIANATQHTPYYATSSERLARDVQALLLRLGLVSRVTEKSFRTRGGRRPGWTVHLLGEGAAEAFLERIAPYIVGRADQVERLRRHVATLEAISETNQPLRPAGHLPYPGEESVCKPDSPPGQGEMSADRGGRPRKNNPPSNLPDVYWDEVVRITPRGTADTYDLTVEEDHNFVADGLVVHNSHSAAYSLVAYQTAYLKAHYPAEFMAAAMTNEMGDTKKLTPVLDEARKMGLDLLPPCVNHSVAPFSVDDGRIRFGMGGIKGAGLSAIEALVEARDEHGPFASIFGLTKNLDLRATGRRMLEALGRAGALDALEGHRAQLVAAMDAAVRYGQKVQADRAAGQNSLFGGGEIGSAEMEPALPDADPWGTAQALKEERSVIGFYISGHPLEAFRAEAEAFATAELNEIDRFEEAQAMNVGGDGYGRNRGPTETFCGILTEVNRHTTKSGKPIAFANLEDFAGQGEVVCFASVLDRIQNYLEVDKVVLVKGDVEVRGGVVKIIAQDVIPMWKVHEQMVKALILRVRPDRIEEAHVKELRALCDQYPGRCKLYFDLLVPGMPEPHRIRSRSCVVEPTSEFLSQIRQLLGPRSIMLRQEA